MFCQTPKRRSITTLCKKNWRHKLWPEAYRQVQAYERAEIAAAPAHQAYTTNDAAGVDWRLMLGDSAERMGSYRQFDWFVGLFPAVRQPVHLQQQERDLGNSRTVAEFFQHYQYLIAEILRVTVPGRNTCVHVHARSPRCWSAMATLASRTFGRYKSAPTRRQAGFMTAKCASTKTPSANNPVQRAKALMFVQLHKDSSWSRPALADYILKFRKPGTNPAHSAGCQQ